MKEKIIKTIQFILNPRLLLCLFLGWMLTNGWSYILFGIGTYLDIPWMVALSGAYIAFLWLPLSPEKLVTIAIAVALLRLIFPDDKKTLAVLLAIKNRIKERKKTHRK